PEQPIHHLPLLLLEEQAHLLQAWQAPQEARGSRRHVLALFEEQVARTPEAIALVSQDAHLSYGALAQRANQLAHLLAQHGVGPEVLVGVCLPRSLEQFLAVWAILKAGGASLPLDGSLPQARLAFLLNDAGCSLLLTRSQQVLPPTVHPLRRLHLEQLWTRLPQQPAQAPQGILAPEQLAYVIYTSGSTGVPKGCWSATRDWAIWRWPRPRPLPCSPGVGNCNWPP